jgi:hypothetical protein
MRGAKLRAATVDDHAADDHADDDAITNIQGQKTTSIPLP